MKRLTSSRIATMSSVSLAVLAVLSLAGAARANDAAGPAPTATMAAAAEPAGTTAIAVVNHDEQRIKDLHDRLQIKLSQEASWSKVADVMRNNDGTMDALAKARHETAATRTATEDLRSYGEITEAHAASIRTFAAAFGGLYDSMSAAQKQNADDVFRSKDHKTPKTSK